MAARIGYGMSSSKRAASAKSPRICLPHTKSNKAFAIKALFCRQKIRLARTFVCFPDTSCGGPLQVCHDGLKLVIADRDTFVLKVPFEFVEDSGTLAYEVR